jgi:hypothetical protein
MGDKGSANNILVGKFEMETHLTRPRCRWEGDIKMKFREVEWQIFGLESSG